MLRSEAAPGDAYDLAHETVAPSAESFSAIQEVGAAAVAFKWPTMMMPSGAESAEYASPSSGKPAIRRDHWCAPESLNFATIGVFFPPAVNWMMHALTLRTYAALIARNATKVAAIKPTLNAFVASSFTTPGGFMLSSCTNLRAIGVYGSYDLQERDAFKYHMVGLQDSLELGTLEPTFLDSAALTAATNALSLLKDYVTGAKVHNEFVCSTVAFDRERADAGTPGFSGPYVPSSSKEAFRYGRIVVPASRSWTSSLATADYSDWLKVLISGRGDEIVY